MKRVWLIAGTFVGILIVVLGFTKLGSAETFNVGYYSDGAPPTWFAEDDPRKGIYVEILEQVSAITGDTFVKQYAPQARIAAKFGVDYDIEPGVSPIFYPEQDAISVYSIPFFVYEEGVIMRKSKAFPVHSVGDLEGHSVGVIRGYVYPNWTPEQGHYIPDPAKDDTELFKKFQGKRYDILFAGIPIAKYYAKDMGIDIEIVPTNSTELSFRFHISKQSAVERFNNALNTLLENGTIDAITKKYLE